MKDIIILFALFIAVFIKSCTKLEVFNEDVDDTVPSENVEMSGAVDLGLSVEWAACDLGSNAPYVIGYKYTSYELRNFYPATDELGEEWSVPTRQEVDELLADCRFKFGKFHNVSGWFITGPSGKTIFICTGKIWISSRYQDEGLVLPDNSYGNYDKPEVMYNTSDAPIRLVKRK